MIEIRKATLKDLDAIYEIEQSSFVNPWKKSDIEYEISANPVNVFLVALSENTVVGYLDFLITFNSASIVQIATKSDVRNRHIATYLLNEMFKILPSKGEEKVEFVTLEVRQSNDIAFSMYKKFGFEFITIKKNYYANGEDALYMVKRM